MSWNIEQWSKMNVLEELDSSKTGVFCFLVFLTNGRGLILVLVKK